MAMGSSLLEVARLQQKLLPKTLEHPPGKRFGQSRSSGVLSGLKTQASGREPLASGTQAATSRSRPAPSGRADNSLLERLASSRRMPERIRGGALEKLEAIAAARAEAEDRCEVLPNDRFATSEHKFGVTSREAIAGPSMEEMLQALEDASRPLPRKGPTVNVVSLQTAPVDLEMQMPDASVQIPFQRSVASTADAAHVPLLSASQSLRELASGEMLSPMTKRKFWAGRSPIQRLAETASGEEPGKELGKHGKDLGGTTGWSSESMNAPGMSSLRGSLCDAPRHQPHWEDIHWLEPPPGADTGAGHHIRRHSPALERGANRNCSPMGARLHVQALAATAHLATMPVMLSRAEAACARTSPDSMKSTLASTGFKSGFNGTSSSSPSDFGGMSLDGWRMRSLERNTLRSVLSVSN